MSTMLPQSEFDRPYGERQKVALEAKLDDTLASLREQAFEAFGFKVPDATYSHGQPAFGPSPFFKEGDQDGFVGRAIPRMFWGQLTLVDDQGHALFGVHDHRSVTLGDLFRASEAGVLDGDPSRPYVIAEGGWGDQPPPDWPTIIHGFEIAWPYVQSLVEGAAVAITTKEVWNRLWKRIKDGSEAANNHREWAQRKFGPYQFQAQVGS